MSQFHPAFRAGSYPLLDRPLLKEEYDEVVAAMKKMGFRNGWVQDMDSNVNYIPDFSKQHPFE
jgi:putative pyruvate formate lyase activating enzyme